MITSRRMVSSIPLSLLQAFVGTTERAHALLSLATLPSLRIHFILPFTYVRSIDHVV